MPVEFIKKKAGPKRLRFLRNTAYNGTNYGPDYPQAECEVDAASAFLFIGQQRAIDLDAPPPAATEAGIVQTRDPQPQHRDPVISSSAGPDSEAEAPAQTKSRGRKSKAEQ